MAVTGHDLCRRRFLGFLGAALAARLSLAQADQSAELRSRIRYVANALTDHNPSDALTPFSKQFVDYAKLRNYFTGLTNAFNVISEVDFLDEAAGDRPELTLRWALNLSDVQANFTSRRVADIHVKFAKEKTKWKIVEFAPIDLFDPSQAQTSTPSPQS